MSSQLYYNHFQNLAKVVKHLEGGGIREDTEILKDMTMTHGVTIGELTKQQKEEGTWPQVSFLVLRSSDVAGSPTICKMIFSKV